ncbi:MlaD family protein [Candidatus Zixiibacteriota bacterium]
MIRSGRVKWSEVHVGMVLLFAFALLLWASFTGSGFSVFAKTESLVAFFPGVNGLVSGAPVWMAGLEVGYVTGIEFVSIDGASKVRVDFKVKRKVFPMITTDSKVAVGTMGLMGDKYLDIQIGRPGVPLVSPGAELGIVQSTDLTNMFSGAPDLMEQLGNAVGQLSTFLERVNRGEGFLGGLMTESPTSAADSLIFAARKLLIEINSSQKKLTVALSETSTKLNHLAETIEQGDGTLGRLVRDSALHVSLSSMSGRADRLLAKLEQGEGTAGRLISDDAAYDDIRVLLGELRALIDDIKQHPKKYFKVSLF